MNEKLIINVSYLWREQQEINLEMECFTVAGDSLLLYLSFNALYPFIMNHWPAYRFWNHTDQVWILAFLGYADHFWVSLIYVAMCVGSLRGCPTGMGVWMHLQSWPKCSPQVWFAQPLPLPSHEGTDTSGTLIWNTVHGSGIVDIFRVRHVGGQMPFVEKTKWRC